MDGKNIGILYEGGQESAYEGIIWETLSLTELLEK
jgi:sialidase-1